MTFPLLLLLVVALLLFHAWLGGANLSSFDRGYPTPVAGDPPSQEVHSVIQAVEAFAASSGGGRPNRERVQKLRSALESISEGKTYSSTIRPTRPGEPKGEWVLAEHADSTRRLLYVHGGAFIAGSPNSHRTITDALAQMTGMAVLSLDYRLVPEHPRLAGLEDTVGALEWLADNGPDGSSTAMTLAVAGDSAGGNLTLAAIQQLRDRGSRNVDAAVAICPVTDIALQSPSLHFNTDTDLMLGHSFGRLVKTPSPIRHVALTAAGRRRPAAPELSPLRGVLTGLPPVLLQASTTEMLLDDSARYYHRAREAGAEVEFETYANMVHVWHMFYPELPEASIALEHIADFLRRRRCVTELPDAGEVEA